MKEKARASELRWHDSLAAKSVQAAWRTLGKDKGREEPVTATFAASRVGFVEENVPRTSPATTELN